jgi:hypothetical protein
MEQSYDMCNVGNSMPHDLSQLLPPRSSSSHPSTSDPAKTTEQLHNQGMQRLGTQQRKRATSSSSWSSWLNAGDEEDYLSESCIVM